MTAIDKNFNAPTPAPHQPFTPSSTIPRSTVQTAIDYVYATLAASISAISDALTLAQYTADDARSIAMTARGMAREAQRANQNDNAQTILHSQVFN